ncbi:class I SAM-dependent methyltransferase [Actinoplanes sp. NBRC 101535]|uniref:class I SAM-dependent methyltransferase n=1 Tax=Actinoplanes sp. NBRC 101535 TaxID=3032196 RepID=UPI0024A31A13|nr:class I SAM-dependent methyltransferase [Actinoplanes sp. NBRC 101535]GLY08637.1 methyltransferase [Actinoplanes sp. NBRC 101535]
MSSSHWAAYNARQAARPVRELCRRVIDLAGPGRARTAVDLGCGAGRETRALLDAGWRVIALDGEPGTPQRVTRTIGGRHPALEIRVQDFTEIRELPDADLIYAGYALPHQPPASFDRVWAAARAALRPGGWLAADLFGDRDSWAGNPQLTFLEEGELRERLHGLEIVHWREEDAPGPAFSGPKHWHVFEVIGTSPAGGVDRDLDAGRP